MSLEAQIEKLTAAVKDNTAAIEKILSQPAAQASASPAPQPSPSRTGRGGRRSAASKSAEDDGLAILKNALAHLTKDEQKSVLADAVKDTPFKKVGDVPPEHYEAVANAARLKRVQNATLKVVEVSGRDVAVGILAEFNVKKAGELNPSQYPEVFAKLNKAIEAAQAEPEAPAADDLV